MKKILSLILAVCLLSVPAAMGAEVESGADLRVVAVCDNESIEVGDQFLVKIMLDGNFDKYLTYSVVGSFDFETAELVAPVYKDDGFSIVWNEFSNESGVFQFDAADIAHLSGSDDALICSLLFKAKKAGSFSVRLGHASSEDADFFLGRASGSGDKYDYDFTVESFETEISENSGSDSVVIISEKKKATPYDDMDDHEWAEIAVGALSRLGVLDGIAEESFEPDKSVTRGEFTAMLVRSAKIEGSGDLFPDVPEDYPFAEELAAAKAAGIALGGEDGNFNPDATVTRQDISAFVYRALKYKNKIKTYDSSVLAAFPDSDEISGYAVPSMTAIVGARLMKGDDKGMLNPSKEMTRAEAAVLLESVIIHIKLVK